VVAAVAVFMLCSPLPAGAGFSSYLFPQIYEAPAPEWVGGPAINASGQVAFFELGDVNDWSGSQAIYKGAVGSLEKIIDNTVSFDSFGTISTINDLGDVAFDGVLSSGHSQIVRYTAATQGLTTIAEGDGNDPNAAFTSVDGSSINNAGAVAFRGRNSNTGQEFIAAGAGGNVVYVHVVSQPWKLGFPMMRAESPTLEMVWWSGIWGDPLGGDPPTFPRIDKGGSLNHTTIAEGQPLSPQFLELHNGPSISNSGDVSFSGKLAGGGEGIFYGNGGANTLVADTTGEFDWFYHATAISATGVAFNASLDISGGGVFTGPNILTDKVLAYGDTIAGYPSTVESVSVSSHGMNDKGQIALLVRFADGTHRILRADPFILSKVLEWLFAVASMKSQQSASVISQIVPIPLGAEDLSFDYHFPTTTGQLVVTLGGEVVAQIDAPADLADGFTTFLITSADIARLLPDPPDELLLQFSLQGSSDTAGLFLDNIVFGDLENGGFATGDLEGWRTAFGEDGGIGVAIDPFDPRARVPEPATMSLLLMGAAGLLAKRRRQAT
jgi:hypothetical protein